MFYVHLAEPPLPDGRDSNSKTTPTANKNLLPADGTHVCVLRSFPAAGRGEMEAILIGTGLLSASPGRIEIRAFKPLA